MPTSVSVIVPTYNYGRFIADALNSALQQTVRPAELIVVDDGSTDDTSEVVKRFGSSVRYIRQANSGVCAARNRGIAESNGDFIAFLDADDIWAPTKLEKQLAKFAEDPQVGLVHCGMREFDIQTGETIATHLEGQDGWVADEIALWERPAIIGPGGTIVVKRDVVRTVGGYDTALTNAEDWEFCFRVARKYKVGFVREVLVDYRSHGQNATKKVPQMERSTLLAWGKVFNGRDRHIQRLRRRSYGNLHKVLAGSFLQAGDYAGFLRNFAKSLWYRPSFLLFYLGRSVSRRNNQ